MRQNGPMTASLIHIAHSLTGSIPQDLHPKARERQVINSYSHSQKFLQSRELFREYVVKLFLPTTVHTAPCFSLEKNFEG